METSTKTFKAIAGVITTVQKKKAKTYTSAVPWQFVHDMGIDGGDTLVWIQLAPKKWLIRKTDDIEVLCSLEYEGALENYLNMKYDPNYAKIDEDLSPPLLSPEDQAVLDATQPSTSADSEDTEW